MRHFFFHFTKMGVEVDSGDGSALYERNLFEKFLLSILYKKST